MTSFPGLYSTPRQSIPAGKLIDVAVGDVDLDGRPDVVLLDDLGQLWLEQNPATLDANKPGLSGAMTPLYRVPEFYLGHTGALAIADVDGQPGVEVVVVTEVGGAVLKRQPDGSFATLVADPRLRGRDAVLADLDGRNGPELVRAGTTLVVHQNPGNGRYDPAPPPGLTIAASALAAVDLNGDGRPDVVALAQNAADVMVLLNNAGQLASPSVLPLRNLTCPATAAMAVQDASRDFFAPSRKLNRWGVRSHERVERQLTTSTPSDDFGAISNGMNVSESRLSRYECHDLRVSQDRLYVNSPFTIDGYLSST